MQKQESSRQDSAGMHKVLDIGVRLGGVVLLVGWCLDIVKPFIVPAIWGVIIAVAVYPAYKKLCQILRGRNRLAAILIVLFMVLVIIGPSAMLADTLVQGGGAIVKKLKDGSFAIPPPPEKVASWPVVGEAVDDFWRLASENLPAALGKFKSEIATLGGKVLSGAAGILVGLLMFTFAILIAGVLLHKAESGSITADAIAFRIAGKKGEGYVDLARDTVRSVARGILGVALIQSILAGLGFLVVGLPGAGLLALVCLFLSVIQVGPGLVIVPTVVYVFATSETLAATLFLIWSIFVTLIDNFLKPVLLGRGVRTPMIVIFMGAIGGFLSSGIIGLFVGAVILALGYELFTAWLKEKSAV